MIVRWFKDGGWVASRYGDYLARTPLHRHAQPPIVKLGGVAFARQTADALLPLPVVEKIGKPNGH